MTDAILHFSVGPVQDFIADARRTRDLWAGSFLLSWLSGQAIAAVIEEHGRIVFPGTDSDPLFRAIQTVNSTETPYIGSLPNRFKAVAPIGTGMKCAERVREKWKDVANAVWKKFVQEPAAKGNNTKLIWDRQVRTFWDITWVEGEPPSDNSDSKWLDRRKSWRSHYTFEAEDGDLCRLMGRYQEISGYHRIGESTKQSTFYTALRSQKYRHPETLAQRELGELNIGQTERLCAIALIKRLFPLLDDIDKVIGWRPGGGALTIVNWPSVSYIAAVPWLRAIKSTDGDAYFKAVEGTVLKEYRGEIETRLFNLPVSQASSLDGHLLHEDGIRSWPNNLVRGVDASTKNANRAKLLAAHKALREKLKGKNGPTEFYALLLMDGDSVGERIADYSDLVKVGLAKFTTAVADYFNPQKPEKNPADGVLIYAGGDDVLALLPVDKAVEAAKRMRVEYRKAFDGVPSDKAMGAGEFTLSGAIVLAQYQVPFRSVLQSAHHYLDDIAKDKNGRDSLAIAVMKPGGVALEWVSCWEQSVDPVSTLEEIARDGEGFSSGLLHNLRSRYAPLFAIVDEADEGRVGEGPLCLDDPKLMEAVIKAEYLKQGNAEELTGRVDGDVQKLMTVGTALHRRDSQIVVGDGFNFDGPLLARFLSDESRRESTAPNVGEGAEK